MLRCVLARVFIIKLSKLPTGDGERRLQDISIGTLTRMNCAFVTIYKDGCSCLVGGASIIARPGNAKREKASDIKHHKTRNKEPFMNALRRC